MDIVARYIVAREAMKHPVGGGDVGTGGLAPPVVKYEASVFRMLARISSRGAGRSTCTWRTGSTHHSLFRSICKRIP